MNRMRHIMLLCLVFQSVWAEAQIILSDTLRKGKAVQELTIGADLMTRGEIRNGGLANEDEDEASFVLERTRIPIHYKRPNLEVQITPQHTGVWGTSGNGSMNMREAWIRLESNGGLFAKVGRQSLTYDDERIIGLDEWSMTSSFHDALKLGYEGHGHKVHGIFAYNQNNENMNGGTKYMNGGQPYKNMQTLWYHYDVCRNLGASLLFINTGMQRDLAGVSAKTVYQQLYGGYLRYAPGNLVVDASYYRQAGDDEHDVPIHAWMVSAEAKWQIDQRWHSNAGYYKLSGDENFTIPGAGDIGLQHHTKNNAFSLLYASHHQFYGAMDFIYLSTFYGGYSPGLQDLHAGVGFKPIPTICLNGQYHYLSTSVQVHNTGKSLGHELELTASWKIMKDVTLTAGYTYIRGTNTMKTLKRSDDDLHMHWGWLMFSVSPKILQLRF